MFIQAGFTWGYLWSVQPRVTQRDTAQNSPLCWCFGSGITRASLKLEQLAGDKITTLLELGFWRGGSLMWLMITMKNVQILPLLWQRQCQWGSGNLCSTVTPWCHCSWVSPGRQPPELQWNSTKPEKFPYSRRRQMLDFWRGSNVHDWFPHHQFLCHFPHLCSWCWQKDWVVTQGKWPCGPGGLAYGHIKRTQTGMNQKDVNSSLIDGSA